jgi:hypothetical protein
MKKELALAIAAIIVLLSFLFVYVGASKQGPERDFYIACGCGCCADNGLEPITQCIYHSSGESLEQAMQNDKEMRASPRCEVMGCFLPVKYAYCD